MKKTLCLLLILTLVFSLLAGCGSNGGTLPEIKNAKIDLGNKISEINGNTVKTELKFSSEEEMLAAMSLACENNSFELYFSPDSMAVALKEKASGKVLLSNPYNAALDTNYSGVIGQKLDSQIVLSFLEKETKIVDFYSSTECADKGQYKIETYENGLSFDMTFGEDEDSEMRTPKVFTKERYKEICKKVSEDSKDLLDTYYSFYEASELSDSGIYDIYPDIKKQSLYFCSVKFSERDERKLSAVFAEAGYTAEDAKKDAKELALGESAESNPYFKLTLEYLLTDTGVTVNIPNKSIKYNPDFPLLRISVLPYFGADEAGKDAAGYLFIPDGSGAVINMNQEEPNRRTIMTGKVYGENSSHLPLKTAAERTEQYYLPVFGTVRNNESAIFGIITSGDGNCEITSMLGRPNGNYYTVNPEFVFTDYEQYTRISVVSNAWSNKSLYLYDKNTAEEDFTVQYTLLSNDKANYSSMAKVYKEYIFGSEDAEVSKTVLNLQTVGSTLVNKTFLGFSYDAETVFTGYDDNIEIIKQLKQNKADNISLMLKGWQKDGLDTAISSKIRVSSALGGKAALKNLANYCKDEKIPLSLYNDISFVGFDKSFDGFSPKNDAARTLELKYAKKSRISPDTMLYDDGKYVVKASSYNKYLTGLIESAKDYTAWLNMGELGTSLNADYTKSKGINRCQALRYLKQALKANGKASLSFDKGNAYVLPYAKEISDISVDNSGFTGETAAVPFIQLVLSGNIPYSSEPVNLKEDLRKELLKCIEGGTTPTFLLSYRNTSAFKGTKYTDYYSVDYEILKDSVLFDSYEYVNKVFTEIGNSSLISHEILADSITVSTYKNGVKVYVNKSDKDYSADGITVPAGDYVIKG